MAVKELLASMHAIGSMLTVPMTSFAAVGPAGPTDAVVQLGILGSLGQAVVPLSVDESSVGQSADVTIVASSAENLSVASSTEGQSLSIEAIAAAAIAAEN